MRRRHFLGALAAAPFAAYAADKPIDGGPFVPTPWVILDEMIKLAEVRANDVVVDLGAGDGRLVIAAAKRFGARGFGVERDATLVQYANRQAASEKVAERVKFLQGDVFAADVRGATVVTLYLLPRLVEKLVPKLRAELPAGARIVSHDYALKPWPADKTLIFDVEEKAHINGTTQTTLYYYVVPARIGGRWRLELPDEPPLALTIEQEPDRLEGVARAAERSHALRDLSVRGDTIRFSLLLAGRLVDFRGKVSGATMAGDTRSRGDSGKWSARVDSGA